MSLITRCPECQTMFRLVPDQLRLSEGWVRCGQCEGVFDATANLYDGVSPPIEETLAQRFSEAPIEDQSPSDLALPPEESFEPVLAHETLASTPVADNIAVHVDADEVRSPSRPASDLDVPPGVTFIQQPIKTERPQQPWVRRLLVLSCLVLGIALALQFLVSERDRIAASEPALKPALVSLCEVFQCEVRPLRQIESIVIDSSSFNKVRGDVYRLNLTLKNMSQISLAAPAIELSLTDMQDQPIMRRVFQPAELGNVASSIGAGAELASTLALSIKPNGPTDRIAGYRVTAFYP